jgi:hypothetical protein
MIKQVTTESIESIVGFKVSDDCDRMIKEFNLEYEDLDKNERDGVILKVIEHLGSDLIPAGEHRLNQWENGWNQNLEMIKDGGSTANLVPKYFGKYDHIRIDDDFYKTSIKDFDYKNLIIFVDAFLHEYVGTKYENLFEFGCGPAYHLLRFGNFNKHISLFGLDWTESSQKIIEEIKKLAINGKIQGFNFNFFDPDYNLVIPDSSAIFTCNALEQVGDNFEKFVNFLVEKSPDLCINFEPLTELLSDEILLDKLSILYSQKRNYLKGYHTHLRNLEKDGKIKIISEQRLKFGSLFLESISVVIWKPLKK